MQDSKAISPRPRRSRKGAPPGPRDVLGTLTEANPTKVADGKPDQPSPAVRAKDAEAPPRPAAKPGKTEAKRSKPLNFRVTPEFRKAFKQAATAEDVKKVELLERIFSEWQARRR